MAKMKLSESTFTLIPEGVTTFKVMEVNDEKYEDFGKLEVKLQTVKGETHIERFSLIKFKADEIDTQDIVGCYITATVKHETYTRTKGDKAGTEATTVRLNDYTTASGFGGSKAVKPEEPVTNESDDLDDLDL